MDGAVEAMARADQMEERDHAYAEHFNKLIAVVRELPPNERSMMSNRRWTQTEAKTAPLGRSVKAG